MEQLRNLHEIGILAGKRFCTYEGKDFILPEYIKKQILEINGCQIEYHRYSAVLKTKGNLKGILNIYMPNQWFYIASYFTDLYNELGKYKAYALQVTTKERLKGLDKSSLNEIEMRNLHSLDLDEESKEFLERFITDYKWWAGAKTIDRGDYYISPILSYAKLVNASQSYVADLCAFLSDKNEIVKAIISGAERQENLQDSGELIPPRYDSAILDSRNYAYMAAIKTKPFLILGGFSGTGKSLLVKRLAFATCPCDGVLNTSETSPGNYLLVSVKPNWHDATDITGFRSSVNRNYYVTDFMRFLVKAKHHPEVPFFVCLDEMNLAPVEEYFADFLSVIESRKRKKDGTVVTDAIVPASVFKADDYADDFNIFLQLGLKPINQVKDITEFTAKIKKAEEEESDFFEQSWLVDELKRDGLTIPQNVVIIGTVNMDDTTNSFSRKVIDRAMTFETIVGKFDQTYFDSDVKLGYVKNYCKGAFFISDEVRATEMLEEGRFELPVDEKMQIINFINSINSDLSGTPFKISYRILNETILLYRAKIQIAELLKEEHEDGVNINVDLNSIFDDVLMQKVLPRIEGDYEKCDACLVKLSARADRNNWEQSYDKIEFMIKRFGSDHSGFTSFWN
nr:hypothetical protein [Prevotella sp.]